ncbi:hypothetical protein [Nonomuraea turcica]|uniref:hypothetical protein n=1 Tax=Nonomuraea sp. G32 TaxID=3067274 RepID=UPI00273C4DE3|nr:hypothetical protein [Nonomuraea sp. G32]MDP4504185.1 hypothetical protein [Nonomuraea sp. G32]
MILQLANLLMAVTITGAVLPDPAPAGPDRPYEPPVGGPENLDTLDVDVAPDGGGHNGVTITFDRRSRTESGEKPAAARRFVFLFDRSVRLRPEAFPVCDEAALREWGPAACPSGSRVGSGSARYHGSAGTQEVLAFNGRTPDGTPLVLVSIPASKTVLPQTLERAAPPYQKKYRIALDEILPPNATPPQDRGATTRFTLSFGAARGSVSYVEAPPRRLDFALWSEFVTGQRLMTPAAQ